MDFGPEDVRQIFARSGDLESIERKPPRDFVYTVRLRSGDTVTGRVVARNDLGVTLGGTGDTNVGVAWDDVASITVTVE